MRVCAIIGLTALVSAGTAWAQPANPNAGNAGVGNPAGASPDTVQAPPGVPLPRRPNAADRGFARMAAMGGEAEVALGRLANQRGQFGAVKEFAARMVADHTLANEQLTTLAQAGRIALPKEPGASYREMLARLERAEGKEFDLTYIRGQIADHEMTAQLLAYEIGSGQDEQLKAFASQALPVVLQHLRMAQRIDAELSGAGLPEAALGASGPRSQ